MDFNELNKTKQLNQEINKVFKENVTSFGLKNAAEILKLDPSFLQMVVNHKGSTYENSKIRYLIRLSEYTKKYRRKQKVRRIS